MYPNQRKKLHKRSCQIKRISTHGVYVEHVYGEVVGRQIHGLEDLLEGHGLVLAPRDAHLRLRLGLEGLLDEAQQMLLVHARGGVDVSVNLYKVIRLCTSCIQWRCRHNKTFVKYMASSEE